MTYLLSLLIVDPNGMRDAVNLEHHIHYLEIEAYTSMLKAFIAQSDLLTWGKEELLTELRKELNIADSEHGQILSKINSDETIRWIREQRKRASHSHAQGYIQTNTSGCHSASIGNSVIRLKTPSLATFYPQNISHSQASLNSIHVSAPMSVYGSVEKPKEMFNYDVQLPPIGRGSVPKGNYQFKQYCQPSESLTLNNRDNIIEIRATDRVIHDVEKMLFGREKPSPVDIENAKQALDEQERAILEALGKLGKLGDVLDRDDRVLRNLQSRARNDGQW
ncbi:protein EMSY-LIKE 4-like [Vicia villosa]|uniref:protein EMSY-LIKE 4-like n=1 Tax=Vicia villosa TaxID=3911 RepID=UPI00273CC06E|nr:protein EMSY-LIKE 4-like [Vicia villosa]